jgi:hypothetical protein
MWRRFFSFTGILGAISGAALATMLAAGVHPTPETRTRKKKIETRDPKPETRNLKPETSNPKPETLNPKPETLNPEH